MKESILKKFVLENYHQELPISGGAGTSLEDAIVLQWMPFGNDFINLEYVCLKYMGVMRREVWDLQQQAFFKRDGRSYDVFTIKVSILDGDDIEFKQEEVFFDITDCMEKAKADPNFDEEMVMNRIAALIEQRATENNFIKESYEIFKQGNLDADNPRLYQLTEELYRGELAELFNQMMFQRKKPMIEVLEILAAK